MSFHFLSTLPSPKPQQELISSKVLQVSLISEQSLTTSQNFLTPNQQVFNMQFTLSVITALVAGLSMAQQTSVPASAPAEPSAPAPVASSVAFTIMPYGAASAKPSISSSVVDPFPQVAMSSVAPNGVAPEVHQPRASIDPPYRPSAVIGHEVKDQAPFCCDPKLLPTCSVSSSRPLVLAMGEVTNASAFTDRMYPGQLPSQPLRRSLGLCLHLQGVRLSLYFLCLALWTLTCLQVRSSSTSLSAVVLRSAVARLERKSPYASSLDGCWIN